MKRKIRPKRRPRPLPVRLKTYRNGGVGMGSRALVHKGEMIDRNTFGN